MNHSKQPILAPRERLRLTLPGYAAIGLPPNEALQRVRTLELSERPAPFSTDRLLLEDELRANVAHRSVASTVRPCCRSGLEDVPIARIVGISNDGNLDNFAPGMTFGEVLFHCLHGASFLWPESIDYLCGDAVKSDGQQGFREFPQIEGISKINPKYRAVRGISFTRYGDDYIADQGKQRAIIARYAIFQQSGIAGLLRNVYVSYAS